MSGLYVVNLGCKVNRVESDSILALAQRYDWLAQNKETASLIVVNTCAVTAEAQKKTRKAIRQALHANQNAQIVVTGCSAALYAQEIVEMDTRINIVAKHQLEAFIEQCIEQQGLYVTEHSSSNLRVGTQFPTRVGIKVQDGCSHACTYCIVHVARGHVWSKPHQSVIDEAFAYQQHGVRELVFAGINLGSYQDGVYDLADLVEAVLNKTAGVDEHAIPLMRVRLSSIEPCDVSERLIELLALQEGRLCRHLHIPLQAGSSRVLREMNRPYDAETYRALIKRLRKALPNVSLSTDVIVGFPGETEDDFEQTLRLSEECGFSKIHVFPYSRREGTPAAVRTDQISAQEKQKRARRLRDLCAQLRTQDYEARRGTEELVVVEQKGQGLTESYHTVSIDEAIPSGSMVRMHL